MATFSKLSPGDLAKYLNSFPDLGTVMGPDQASRNLRKAGFRIAADPDGKTINGFRYAAWLFDEIQTAAQRITVPRTYDEIKEAARKRAAEASASAAMMHSEFLNFFILQHSLLQYLGRRLGHESEIRYFYPIQCKFLLLIALYLCSTLAGNNFSA